jgi:hypothetical protein
MTTGSNNRRMMMTNKVVYVPSPTYAQMTKWLTENGWRRDPHPEAGRTGGAGSEFWKEITIGYMIEIPKIDNPALAQAALILIGQAIKQPWEDVYVSMCGRLTDPDLQEIDRLRKALTVIMRWFGKSKSSTNQKIILEIRRVLAMKDYKLPDEL